MSAMKLLALASLTLSLCSLTAAAQSFPLTHDQAIEAVARWQGYQAGFAAADQAPPEPTAHAHSTAATALAADQHLAWAAAYCDEEAAFIECHNVTAHGKHFTLGLKGDISTVELVMLNGKVLKKSEYKLTHTEKPLPPQTAGYHAMTGTLYSDTLTIKRTALPTNEMVVVFHTGYKNYHPHHPEDDVK